MESYPSKLFTAKGETLRAVMLDLSSRPHEQVLLQLQLAKRVYWDRGRPARNEREARNVFVDDNCASWRGAGGTPAVQY